MEEIDDKIFKPINDRMLREGIKKYYFNIVYKYNFEIPIIIQLSEKPFYTANSLNLLLVFIEAIVSIRPDTRVYIDLFDNELVEKILNSDRINNQFIFNGKIIEPNSIEELKRKIIFYEAMSFAKILYDYTISVSPNPKKYDDLQKKLEAFQHESTWRISSKILRLYKLIENEMEQRNLSDRVATMASILRSNLFGRIEKDEAREDSEQIMFELVKNIYQHSVGKNDSNKLIKNSGYACAQILKNPILDKPRIDREKLKDLLFIERQTARKAWRFLCITINDFGIGLTEKIKSDLLDRLKSGSFQYARFNIDNDFIENDENLILFGVTTAFTTKKIHMDESFLERKLASKGYGFIFCISFIAKFYGRIEIRSGTKSVLIIAKPKAYWQNFWRNSDDVEKKIQSNFNDYFAMTANNGWHQYC